MICATCKQTLSHDHVRGWLHAEGGTYMVCCPACGWKGAPYPSPLVCPTCGFKSLHDDHCASPMATPLPEKKP